MRTAGSSHLATNDSIAEFRSLDIADTGLTLFVYGVQAIESATHDTIFTPLLKRFVRL